MADQSLRVLVVDDTAIYRKIVSDVLSRVPGVEVVGIAANGKIAYQKLDQLRPDLVTLDLEMPEMDGLGFLRALQDAGRQLGVIMLSSFTTKGADTTVAALALGAFDFVLKPSGSNVTENADLLARELQQRIEAFARTRSSRTVRPAPPPPAAKAAPGLSQDIVRRMDQVARRPTGKPEVVAIGISTGGPPALNRMLPLLPENLAAPVLIVQHMPPKFTLSLANDLATRCRMPVSEAVDGDVVHAGRMLIAPGGRQMKVVREGDALLVRLTDDPPENHCRPSVDYLFRSVANTCGGNALAVIMTGMGSDGTLGCRLLKRRGAGIIAQDEASCVVYGMPKAPVDEGLADVVVPLAEIASEITRLVGKASPVCK